MSLHKEHETHNQPMPRSISDIGKGFIIIGFVALVGAVSASYSITYLILPAIGMLLFINGLRYSEQMIIHPGILITWFGIGGGILNQTILWENFDHRAGLALAASSTGFICLIVFDYLREKKKSLWALLPAMIGYALSGLLIFSPQRLLDYVLFLCIGTGVAMMVWGLSARMLGLIIPGSLLLGIGPGLYIPWSETSITNGLAQTGVMLVWFAFGWALVVIGVRISVHQFVWWPMIPGGVMAVVGWGLYIGGNPETALGFVGNSGSVLLILIGFYLLMMRRGLHR